MSSRLLRRREPPHFYTDELPPLLESAVQSKAGGSFTLLDLGCGDGAKLHALQRRNLLANARSIVGVDIDPLRIERLKKTRWSNLTALVSDACDVKNLEDKFDVVLCSAIIEHVPDDRKLLREMKRLIASDGVAFLRTSLKKKWGFWLYRRDGVFVLAPEHIRDYPSCDALFTLVRTEGMEIDEYRVTPMQWVSVGDVVLFFLNNFGLIDTAKIRPDAGFWRFARRVKMPIKPFGFSLMT